MASALCRTASRLRPVQIFRRIRASSDLLSSSSPPPACISDHGDFSLPRSFFSLSGGIERLEMDGRCLMSTSASGTTSKPSSGDTETKSSGENEKSGGSEGSDGGGSDQKSDRASGKHARGAPVSWMSFFLLFATGAGLVYYYDREKKRHIEDINTNSKAVKEGPSAGKAAIGGPFSLIRDDGKRITEKDLMGKWTILYFGFTHCPDICPDELIKLAAAIDKIKEKSGVDVVPVFISVDPERDTVQQVHEYVKEFHPKLIGLTGTPEEIKSVARSYRVYYMKTEEEDSDYLVDHSIVMYLMSPEMNFVKFYGKNHDVDSLTDGVVKELRQYRK
ncbi:Protein SCO1-like protein 1 [Raphanus sativus]|uniref:Protein SCO1 homolog 1, mitochondrial isoform X2 n=1 Tax=Raphanus sativus TaxID=3726 RepID=A0A6J0NQC0_RAPSA|nr:protein SCO1 homolog 1, mitochondrial isoform X2 [Raphanus sativus]KAJ4893181.1 Protein SCO1-like protein 1 [Raphanus sativus]